MFVNCISIPVSSECLCMSASTAVMTVSYFKENLCVHVCTKVIRIFSESVINTLCLSVCKTVLSISTYCYEDVCIQISVTGLSPHPVMNTFPHVCAVSLIFSSLKCVCVYLVITISSYLVMNYFACVQPSLFHLLL